MHVRTHARFAGFLLVALSLLLAACGADGKKSRQSCDTSAECVGGICFDDECYSACTSQEDCAAGEEFCVKRKNQQGVETTICVVASEYDGCQLQADCADLVTGPCENRGCNTATGICAVDDKGNNVTCTTPEAYPGTCQAGVCTCAPDCDGKVCGDDGCGGFCGASSVGACPKANQACENGKCICKADCEGRECGSDGCGGLCGTHGGECTGLHDECLDGRCVCQPQCDGKLCGADGCGGTCGECTGEQDACVQGACVCAPDCLQKECGADGCGSFCGELAEGACPGLQDACNDGKCECQPKCVQIVEPTVGEPASAICGPDGCGGFCGELEEGACPGLQDACLEGVCVCQAACDGRNCGADGCGATCGTCTGPQDQCLDGVCTCVPACDGKVCGPDGCGGACGQLAGGGCPGAQDACVEGLCVCQPQCDGKVCGPDGCGGDCGVCKGCTACDAGACVDDPCCLVPKTGCCDGEVLRICVSKKIQQQDCACDNDLGIPCGVAPSCGWNAFAQVYACGTNGGGQPTGELPKDCPSCTPACDDRECGDDGCGGDGSCGTCSPWDTCEAGHCTNVCEQSCEGRECGPDVCGGACGEPGLHGLGDGGCADGLTCTDDGLCVSVCTPQCTGKQCGGDGCGGSCGQCDEGQNCNNGECSNTCIAAPCGDRQCGDDGCGGSCGGYPEGVCPDGLSCTVDGSCGNWCTACGNDPTCSAFGFESGTFFGWALEGAARVVEHLGSALPFEGQYMASLATGGITSGDALASFDLCLPVDVNLVELEWSVFSAEFEALCDQPDRDSVDIVIEGMLDQRQVHVLSAGIADLCRPEACEGCGDQFVGLELTDVSFEQAEVWRTPWSHQSVPLRTLLATNQGKIRLLFGAFQSTDGAHETRLLVDELRFVACDRECTGRECGPDACGGFCGDGETGLCPAEGDVCTSAGACCAPSCFPDQQCGSNGCEGSCGECGPHEGCEMGFCVCQPDCTGRVCGDDGCGGVCGDNDGLCPTEGEVCFEGACCTPTCEGKQCGDDGCGGECWFATHPDSLFCDSDAEVVCVEGACCLPDCSGKQCGDDGCGGDCGTCEGGQDACIDSTCVCQPLCDEAWQCGDDGCGDACAVCPGDRDACVDHQCACEPNCSDVECGDDGCGSDCWWFLNPDSVDYCGGDDNRVCVNHACCTPQCADKVCGTDSCGGTCGACEAGFACNGSQCLEGAVFCADDDLCTVDGWNDVLAACENLPADCDDGDPLTHDSCNPASGACEHVMCTPGCDGAWQCGVDDCGNSCGACEGTQDTCVDHTCVCQPACDGRACGSDGCGSTCGECVLPNVCEPATGVCVPGT